MSTQIDLLKIGKKAYKDSQQDGLMEIMMGLILMTFGGFFYSPIFAFYILLIVFSGKIVEFVRRRYTHPRIGFVRFHRENPKDALTGVFLFELSVIVIIFTLISIFGNVTDYSSWVNWAPLFFGMILVGPFAHAASKSGSVRYSGYAILSVILGILFSLIEFGSGCTGLILYLSLIGGFLVLGGLAIFIRFLRKYPLPETGVRDGSK
ncbi:MAG: hypothetical protein C4B59_05825 [Candidatus Methanogaster sp.]|uniref:Uncharacterized protein n=1 Tax=Candidatus Methanogaster sp. TaxID=3386292 RepID=A0AC61L447_9EURY|nr:MAG: hypothetical protein C4B59_05825 [ANME-2 cluster archaeon]